MPSCVQSLDVITIAIIRNVNRIIPIRMYNSEIHDNHRDHIWDLLRPLLFFKPKNNTKIP